MRPWSLLLGAPGKPGCVPDRFGDAIPAVGNDFLPAFCSGYPGKSYRRNIFSRNDLAALGLLTFSGERKEKFFSISLSSSPGIGGHLAFTSRGDKG